MLTLTILFIFIPGLILAAHLILDAWYYIHDPRNWDKP